MYFLTFTIKVSKRFRINPISFLPKSNSISQLQDQLIKAKAQSKLFEEAVESLHADLEALEGENEKMQKHMKILEQQSK